MKRFLWVAAIATLALSACDPKKKGPNPPSPTTQAMQAMVAQTPAADPSLPEAATVFAQRPDPDATTATR